MCAACLRALFALYLQIRAAMRVRRMLMRANGERERGEGTADVYWPVHGRVHARERARACHNYTHMVAGGMHTW